VTQTDTIRIINASWILQRGGKETITDKPEQNEKQILLHFHSFSNATTFAR